MGHPGNYGYTVVLLRDESLASLLDGGCLRPTPTVGDRAYICTVPPAKGLNLRSAVAHARSEAAYADNRDLKELYPDASSGIEAEPDDYAVVVVFNDTLEPAAHGCQTHLF